MRLETGSIIRYLLLVHIAIDFLINADARFGIFAYKSLPRPGKCNIQSPTPLGLKYRRIALGGKYTILYSCIRVSYIFNTDSLILYIPS